MSGNWLLPDVRLPAGGTVRTIKPLDMRGSGSLPNGPTIADERATDRAPMPETIPSPARPAATEEEEEQPMDMRSKVEAALKEHGPMTTKQMRPHVKCSWLTKLLGNLQRHGAIRKLGGGTRSGIYGLPGQTLKDAPEPEQRAPRRAVRKSPKRAQPKAAPERKAAPKPALRGNGHAAFAINEDGQLGIEKGDGKLSLDPEEFERLRGFIERTEPVWKGA